MHVTSLTRHRLDRIMAVALAALFTVSLLPVQPSRPLDLVGLPISVALRGRLDDVLWQAEGEAAVARNRCSNVCQVKSNAMS